MHTHVHMRRKHTRFFQKSCDSLSVLVLQVWPRAWPLSDTNEIIPCKYAVSIGPENWIAVWGCVVPLSYDDMTVGRG